MIAQRTLSPVVNVGLVGLLSRRAWISTLHLPVLRTYMGGIHTVHSSGEAVDSRIS